MRQESYQPILIMSVIAIGICVAFFIRFEQPAEATTSSVSDAHTIVFQAELNKDLAAKHAEVMAALDAQAAVLARIEDDLRTEQPEEVVKSAVTETVIEPVAASPMRMSTTRWSVEGAWNPSREEMVAHLSGHGVSDTDGYTLEDLHIIHDNLHNGYSATGGAVSSNSAGGWGRARTVTRSYSSNGGGAVRSYASGGGVSRTYSSTRSGGLFSGRLFRNRSYSSCAGGSCR
jgi:hypothetical protein